MARSDHAAAPTLAPYWVAVAGAAAIVGSVLHAFVFEFGSPWAVTTTLGLAGIGMVGGLATRYGRRLTILVVLPTLAALLVLRIVLATINFHVLGSPSLAWPLYDLLSFLGSSNVYRIVIVTGDVLLAAGIGAATAGACRRLPPLLVAVGAVVVGAVVMGLLGPFDDLVWDSLGRARVLMVCLLALTAVLGGLLALLPRVRTRIAPSDVPDGAPTAPAGRTNSFAVAAFVLGLAPVTGVLAIPFGHIARARIRRTGENGDGLAIAGLVLGYISLALWVALGIAVLAAFSSV